MANLKIPKDAIPVFVTIVELDQESFDSVVSIFSAEAPPSMLTNLRKIFLPNWMQLEKQTLWTFCL